MAPTSWMRVGNRLGSVVTVITIVGVACVAAGATLAGAASPRIVEIVRGRVFDAEVFHSDGTTDFRELLVENAAPGSSVELSRSKPCGVRVVRRRVLRTTIVDLGSAASRMRLLPQCVLSVRLTNPDGRTKTLTYTARGGAGPIRSRSCANAARQAVPCSQACPPAGRAPQDVCRGADQTVVAADLATKYVRAAGGVRFTEITVQVEAGSVVSVHCSGPRCPFFVKAAYTPTGGERNIAPMLHIGVLAAGTTVELWVEHENEVGRVFRGIIRRHTVTSRELCISQVDLRPRMCR